MSESARTADQSARKPPGLRERVRATVQAEVVEVAHRLFTEQGFDKTTVDQIAAEVGLSRASLFRYFGTKEDIVLGRLEESGRRIAEALAARPDDEQPWEALRRAFDVLTRMNEAAPPEQVLSYLRMLQETPSLRARHYEKQLSWQKLLVPEIARRLGASQDRPEDTRPSALAAAALACLDVASTAWVACEGTVPLAVLLDRAMGALTK
ncbi:MULTISPECIES: TetR family transcriptional regulator [unclassified Streptomyces]|uniref:TetR family transcriptional regulator n=1 Tax=unclassified Streptomyces TaxID=2593676 RepID=UPI0023650B25|nr:MULTISPECIES: TetR family transcriptional regulator [unclassified Streptomyces]MDF3140639.1 TetR family transcriptional regulator [Streptomyces sp. T21Q-yed]WDF39961.1 TetR family transcriptional regulator [Streptomyces sp. T12]